MTRWTLSAEMAARLTELGRRLVDQDQARVLVAPQQPAAGFWFGGGNMIASRDGSILLVGRYRNQGDSRTGLEAGARGAELAIFRAEAFPGPFERIRTFCKSDLACSGKRVVSIEGAALRETKDGLEVFVSSEKDVAYPAPYGEYRKPGAGVWSIDRFDGRAPESLDPSLIEEVLAGACPAALHVKDPVVFDREDGATAMLFCSHPFTWASSNTGLAVRARGEASFARVTESVLSRGAAWDVAVTRVTERLAVPRVGVFRDTPPLSLYFYDGAECVRSHEEHARARRRARGYSCEEIGGLAWGLDSEFPRMERLSVNEPLFVSPHGTGCSRYVSVLPLKDALCIAWQQSQPDGSQPLVGHALAMEEVERILA